MESLYKALKWCDHKHRVNPDVQIQLKGWNFSQPPNYRKKDRFSRIFEQGVIGSIELSSKNKPLPVERGLIFYHSALIISPYLVLILSGIYKSSIRNSFPGSLLTNMGDSTIMFLLRIVSTS